MAAAREQGRAVLAIRRGVGALVAVVALLAPVVVASPAGAVTRAASAPIAVSVVVPITLDAGTDGLLDADTLEAATSLSGSLTRDLDEVLGTSATIALDPMIPASIRVLGSNAPDTAVAWLSRLQAAPNEVFLLAYADADLSPLARASSLDLSAPLDFGFALDEAAFGPRQTESPSPAATPSPTETPAGDEPPPLPTTDDLLAWPDAVGRIAWPSPGSVAAGDVPAYAAAGYDAILLSSANVSETAGAHADLDGFSGLIADSSASDLFDEASTSVDDATRDQALSRLGVALDGLAAAHPGRSVVLTLDRRSTFAFFSLQETFAAIAARESTRMSTVSEVLTGAAEPARVVDGATQPQVTEGAALADAIRAEAAFATILEDSVLLTAPRRLQLLALLAVQDVAEPEWLDDARAFLERSAEILDSVTVVDTGRVLVASSQTSIPIRIANALDFAVTVRVDATPRRPLLRIDSPVEVTVEPGSSKTVRLDAQAITNGSVTVDVDLTSPTGVAIGRTRPFQVDLQAQWETVGIIVGIIVALVFAGGIARNVIVRRRRAARERAAEAGGPQGAA